MSKLIVEVSQVTSVERHPNADRLAIATVRGWKTCVRFDPETNRAEFEPGDKCVFIPPDAVIPPELANPTDDPVTPGRLGVTAYLKKLPKDETGEHTPGGRVCAARLRGVPSFGLIFPLKEEFGDCLDWPLGKDVAEHFGITKFEPPAEKTEGDRLPVHPLFHTYSDIENYGNHPHLFRVGEPVILTEKIHGKNCRLGYVLDTNDEGEKVWTLMAGSHGVRRAEFDKEGRRSEFWEAITDEVRALLEHLRDESWTRLFGGEDEQRKYSVLLFGEIYGAGVQDMHYGLGNNRREFRAFDIAVNRRYLDHGTKRELFERFHVEAVPILYEGPFSLEVVEEYSAGPTTLCAADVAGRFKGREGVVITPAEERVSPHLDARLILKSISADYHARRGGTEFH